MVFEIFVELISCRTNRTKPMPIARNAFQAFCLKIKHPDFESMYSILSYDPNILWKYAENSCNRTYRWRPKTLKSVLELGDTEYCIGCVKSYRPGHFWGEIILLLLWNVVDIAPNKLNMTIFRKSTLKIDFLHYGKRGKVQNRIKRVLSNPAICPAFYPYPHRLGNLAISE